MKWYNIETVEQLKELGKFREVSKIVKSDCGQIINVKLGSWKNLYNSIIQLKELIRGFEGDKDEVNINRNNNEIDINKSIKKANKDLTKKGKELENNKENIDNVYFISKASEYIFYLVELDGKERMDKLKVTRKHYSNKKLAKEWRDSIAKEIHPDVCKVKYAERAIAKLNQLYAGMISNEK